MKFKVGDRVKQIMHLKEGESPFAIVTGIDDIMISHKHENCNDGNTAFEFDFELAPREEVIYE